MKKELTPQQKIDILTETSIIVRTHEKKFICLCVSIATSRIDMPFISKEYVFDYIPELIKYKPIKMYDEVDGAWFKYNTCSKRVNIINKTIADIKKANNIE